MLQVFQWLETTYASVIDTSWANAIHLSVWLFALTEAAHLLALAGVGCAVLIVDLRILGCGLTRQPVAHVAKEARPWLIGSLVGMAATGFVMFMSLAASKYYSHPAFWMKMSLLAFALTLTFTVRQWIVTGDDGRAQHPLAKVVAAFSILLWTGVAVMGRAGLGYY
jgi:Family of unknown function (DUF6644)